MFLIENHKLLISIIAIGLNFAAFGSYLWSMYQGNTRPHAFTWLIWTITTWIVFFAQEHDGGGMGAWPTGVSAAITTFVTFVSWKAFLEQKPTTSDFVFLAIAIISIALWYLTNSPLWSVIILTLADVFAFIPTLQKTYHDPDSEDLLFYVLSFFKFTVSIFALEHFSMITLTFPVVIALSCVSLILLVYIRKRQLN